MNRIKWIAVGVALGLAAASAVSLAQSSLQPAQINGCVYASSLPILSNNQSVQFQCDVNGQLLVN